MGEFGQAAWFRRCRDRATGHVPPRHDRSTTKRVFSAPSRADCAGARSQQTRRVKPRQKRLLYAPCEHNFGMRVLFLIENKHPGSLKQPCTSSGKLFVGNDQLTIKQVIHLGLGPGREDGQGEYAPWPVADSPINRQTSQAF